MWGVGRINIDNLYIYVYVYIYIYIRYSGEKTKTTFLKNISTYCLLQFYKQFARKNFCVS